MATFFVPDISSQNYPTMLRLLKGHIPDTFNEWSYHHTKRVYELRGEGAITVVVEVNPDEFVSYCRRLGIAYDSQALERFAYDTGTEQDR